VLKHVARCLTEQVRSADTVARLAGDEFVVVLPDVGAERNAVRVAQKILSALHQQLAELTAEVVTASIGISVNAGEEESGDELLRRADEAMYRAKSAGKNRYALAGEESQA
jgi:diguanylate cyclase (GGDEF)-like protein